MRKMTGINHYGMERNFMLVDDKRQGVMLINEKLESQEMNEVYRDGYVFTKNMRDVLGNEKPIPLGIKVINECKNQEDLRNLLDEIESDVDKKPYGFYNYDDNAYIVIKGNKLYKEVYDLDDDFEFEEYNAMYCRYDLLDWLKGYIDNDDEF